MNINLTLKQAIILQISNRIKRAPDDEGEIQFDELHRQPIRSTFKMRFQIQVMKENVIQFNLIVVHFNM